MRIAPRATPKVAIVTDWLTDFGGAERVVLAFRELFPDAPIFTTLYRPERVPQFAGSTVHTSFLQDIPFVRDHHRLAAPFMPEAIESFDFSDYDIVLSSTSSGCAKGVITSTKTLHISYCHNPPRYLWDDAHAYHALHSFNPLLRLLIPGQLKKLRLWDTAASARVDSFITNSAFVAKRIEKYYRRDAVVIPPPVDTAAFAPDKDATTQDYFLTVCRLIPYKRVDLAIQAANILHVPLLVVGTGPDESRLRALAGPTVRFAGSVPESELKSLYARTRALIHPQTEDFGLTAVEVQAAGRPVIAYRAGGALETVVPNRTGLFFTEQTGASLADAIKRFEHTRFIPKVILKHAERFDLTHFKKHLSDHIEHLWHDFKTA